jgi:putative transposase
MRRYVQRDSRRAGASVACHHIKLPAIVQSWRRVWEQVIPFFAYPKEIRKIIYTTNAIESLHMQLRKVLKKRGHFPGDEAATKLIYLALRDITKKWKNPPVTWKLAATQFAIRFGHRLTHNRLFPGRPAAAT